MGALSETWKLLKDTVLSFIDDEALSRGAAIAFYTVTSIAPVLLIVIAIERCPMTSRRRSRRRFATPPRFVDP